jgi:chromosome segregation ATPase
MKILRLQAENVKRLTAVDIVFGDGLITIGGANSAGKSSVLDAVAYALGGQSLIPAEPIRSGEVEGMARLDLGELVVTRKFHRTVTTPASVDGAIPAVFGPTTSTLVVTSKDGAKYPTPQAILDRLLGELSFDPLAFSRATARSQNETLRKLAGIDTEKADDGRKVLVALRTDLKKQLVAQEAQLAAAKHYPGVPVEEIPVSEATAALQGAETMRRVAVAAAGSTTLAQQRVDALQQQHDRTMAQISEWERLIAASREALGGVEESFIKALASRDARRIEQEAAEAAVPDIAATQARIAEIDVTNRRVRENAAYATLASRCAKLVDAVEMKTSEINAGDLAKASALANARFPITGLGLTDEGVTFRGLPFEQASTSEQLRTSVAIGLALNPALKILLIRDGNALDDDSRKLVADQVEAAGAQVLMEFVTSNAGDVSVMIVDGRVA